MVGSAKHTFRFTPRLDQCVKTLERSHRSKKLFLDLKPAPYCSGTLNEMIRAGLIPNKLQKTLPPRGNMNFTYNDYSTELRARKKGNFVLSFYYWDYWAFPAQKTIEIIFKQFGMKTQLLNIEGFETAHLFRSGIKGHC